MLSGWYAYFFTSEGNELKQVDAVLVKLRAKSQEWQLNIDNINSSDVFKKQIEIAQYKNNQEPPELSCELALLQSKKTIIDNLLQEIDKQIGKFNKQEMNVDGLATVLAAILGKMSDHDKNTLNRMRNNNAVYGYYGKRAAVTVAGAAAAMAVSPSGWVAVPAAAVGGGYFASTVDSKIRDQYEDEYFDTASRQLLYDLTKSVQAICDKHKHTAELKNTP